MVLAVRVEALANVSGADEAFEYRLEASGHHAADARTRRGGSTWRAQLPAPSSASCLRRCSGRRRARMRRLTISTATEKAMAK